ncbi:MAG: 30S ribosomal protein S16 [bacterium]
MLQIKLSRIGKKKMPTYRIIILEKSKDPYGKSLEILGHYNPRSKEISLKEDRIQYWLSKGAGATDTMHNLLVAKGVIKGEKIKSYSLTKRRKEKIEKEKGEKKAAGKT